MLVGIRSGKKIRLKIPIPLLVFEETIKAIGDLIWIIEKPFSLLGRRHNESSPNRGLFYLQSSACIIRICSQFFNELRYTGRVTIVDVENGENRVRVDLF
jgi:hypothetical protein